MSSPAAQDSSNRDWLLGFGMAVLAAVGFSAKAIFTKLAYQEGVGAVTLLALRMMLATPFFLAVALREVRRCPLPPLERRDQLAILILGLLGYYLSSLFDFLGLQYISAGLERLILFLYPTFVVLLSALWFGKPFGRREAVAMTLSYTGIGVVFGGEMQSGGQQLWLGSALVVVSTLTFSAYLIGVGETIGRIGTSRFTAYTMLVASTACLLHFVLTQPWQDLLLSARVYQLALGMAIFSTVLPVFMLSGAIRRIGSGHSSLTGMLGPVATLFLANRILDEQLSVAQMLGAALVLLGVFSLSAQPLAGRFRNC